MKKRARYNSARDRKAGRIRDRWQPARYEKHAREIHEPHGPDEKRHAGTAIREQMFHRDAGPRLFRKHETGVLLNLRAQLHSPQYFNDLTRRALLYDQKPNRFTKLPDE